MVQVAKTKKNKKNEQSVKPSNVESIFLLVNDGKKVRIAVGRNIVSAKEFKTESEAEKYIAEKPYELMVNLTCVILKSMQNEKEIQKAVAENAKNA